MSLEFAPYHVPLGPPRRDWLTVAEVAEIFKVGRETVRVWLRSGTLRGARLSPSGARSGRAGWRIHRDEVERVFRGGLRA